MTTDRIEGRARVRLGGEDYVILPSKEFERLTGLAKVAQMPPLPQQDEKGNYPAIEYLRASIARSVIRDRVALDLTQRELARLAGIRVETLCRIETGRHTASTGTIDKLDRALKRAARERERKKASRGRRGPP
jgi:ribosome-binding protein aMBF1 (putative translation factor)